MMYAGVEHLADDGGQFLVPLKFLLRSLKFERNTNSLLSFQRKVFSGWNAGNKEQGLIIFKQAVKLKEFFIHNLLLLFKVRLSGLFWFLVFMFVCFSF